MARPSFSRPLGFGTLLLSSAVFGISVLPAVPHALAQAPAPQRIVTGKVTDKASAPLRNAVVYLKDDHALTVKSFIAGDDGSFRFGQLSQATDYELWAESDGKKSPTKTISSFETKNAITINLKIDK